ncbi:hypothetical protein ACIOEZ_34430 [Streptomyces sp. NPDC087866]|uniref:hypothetical protein n=1 Tax=Streptomyces sp. NPDC087866 TaxID=3365815 RepID=UPI00381967C3
MPGTPSFQIVTSDGQTHTEGRPQPDTFKDLGGAAPVLESYVHDGDYLELRYTDGYRQLIPESRIARIAYTA